MQISRIRLSDKTSRLRPRLAATTRGQAHEPEVPIQVREWIAPTPASPDFVLVSQPPAQPRCGVVVECSICLADGVIVSFQQIDTVAAGQSVTSSMRLLGM